MNKEQKDKLNQFFGLKHGISLSEVDYKYIEKSLRTQPEPTDETVGTITLDKKKMELNIKYKKTF